MKTYGNIILTAAVIFWVFMALRPVSAHLIRMHEFAATGQHWCQWSIAKTCTRWRNGARMNCPPGSNHSGCVIQRRLDAARGQR